jgi:hypothetical protein
MRPHAVPLDSAAGMFDSAKIVYQVDAGQLCEPLAMARIEGQLVSYEQTPSAPLPNHSTGKLTVEYPHPQGKPGFALARVDVISRVPAPTQADKSTAKLLAHGIEWGWRKVVPETNPADMSSETWTLDIPKSHFDLAVGQLNNTGYFTVAKHGAPGVEIQTRLDGKTLDKRWRRVPELDALMLRARNAGQLVAYHRATSDNSRRPQEFASVAAYKNSNFPAAPPQSAIVQGPTPPAPPPATNRLGVPIPTPESAKATPTPAQQFGRFPAAAEIVRR